MKTNSLAAANPHLNNTATSRKRIIRSIASSTAIETGESIKAIETKLSQKTSRYHVPLA